MHEIGRNCTNCEITPNTGHQLGIQPSAISSNFWKPVSDNKELEDYRPEDVAASLLRMISNNIGQLAHSNASRFGPKKMFFAGSFLRHDYTVDSICKGVAFGSGGTSKAMFLRHDGFLGALGAFTSYQNLGLDDQSACGRTQKCALRRREL